MYAGAGRAVASRGRWDDDEWEHLRDHHHRDLHNEALRNGHVPLVLAVEALANHG